MAFDNVPMTRKPALMTAASVLASYDALNGRDHAAVCDLADAMAALIRANLSKLTPKAPKDKPAGFLVDLRNALTLINRVVERRNTIPVLSNVRLTAKGDVLTLTATDLDMEITMDVPAPGVGCWETTAPAERLAKLLGKGAGDLILVPAEQTEEHDGRLEIMVGNAVSGLPTIPAKDFPVMSDPDTTPRFTMSAPALASILEFVRPGVSTEETRYYLNGTYLHPVSDKGEPRLRAVSTDGHRLHLDDMPAPVGMPWFAGVIVPRKTLDVLQKVMAGAETVEIAVTPQKIVFTANGVTLLSKVIDGAFPDYMRVIPRQNDVVYSLDSKPFAEAAARVTSISQEKSRSIKLAWGDDKVTLSVRNMEAGVSEETIEATRRPQSDDCIEIGFNGKYVAESIATLDCDTVEVAMADANSPTLWTDPASPTRLIVLMPLRV